jgi:membrane fusion protein (multidrug efflux system)
MSPAPTGKPASISRLRAADAPPAQETSPSLAIDNGLATDNSAPEGAGLDIDWIAPDEPQSRQPAREQPAEARETREKEPAEADREQDKRKSGGLWQTIRRHPYVTAAVLILLVVLIVAGVMYWLYARQYESTDDAFIDARTASIGAEVSGVITDVPVTDNQMVAGSAVLVRIDARDYTARLAQAKAQVAQAQGNVDNLDAQINAQQARITQAAQQVTQAKAALQFSQQENARYQKLVQTGAGTEQRAQQAISDLTQKQAASDAAEANLAVARRQIDVLKTQREAAVGALGQAQAMQTQAETNLARTTVRAPDAGRVTKLSAAKGTYAQTGQALLMFVPRQVWVTANFKETQLALMRPGQPVTMTVDAYGSRQFKGHVDSIQAGSGTAFSLLPAENATGNYVKVVQRVPVKIVFDNLPSDVLLGPGMSVVPSVKIR